MRRAIVAAVLALAACEGSQEKVKTSLEAKEALLQADIWAKKAHQEAAEAIRVCKDIRSDVCRDLVLSTSNAGVRYQRERNEAESLYLAACRACAPAPECEKDRAAMEQAETRTSVRWTPCLKAEAVAR